jgi:hypothetical protein
VKNLLWGIYKNIFLKLMRSLKLLEMCKTEDLLVSNVGGRQSAIDFGHEPLKAAQA